VKEYDVVIIGSGLGGLLSAAILSKRGYHVCVLEKNNVVGGNLQTFKRDGVILDTGMHYFGSADKGQFIYKLFKYLGIYDDLKLKRLDIDCFDIINFKDQDYVFAQGKDNFVEKLLLQFPKEKVALNEFVKKLDEVGQSGHFFNLRTKNSTEELFKFNPLYSENAFNFISSITKDKTLQNVLAGLNGLIGGGKDKINMFIFGMINYSFIESAWRFVDGSSQLADLLVEKIKLFGGDVFTKTKITQCLTDSNNNINLIKSHDGREFKGKLVVSNIHPSEIFKLLPANALRKSYINRLNSIENSRGMFTLFLVLKEKSFKYLNYNITSSLTGDMWNYNDNNVWPGGYWFSTPPTSKSNEFAESVIVLAPTSHQKFNKWKTTSVEQRGQEYLEYKQKLSEKLISRLQNRFPELKSAIKSYYSATPLTYRDYIGTPNGSAYGYIKDSENQIKTFVLPKTRIPNLLLTGQNINAHGMVGVSTGAITTLSFITDIDEITKEIFNAE